jgi:hypothetical protein
VHRCLGEQTPVSIRLRKTVIEVQVLAAPPDAPVGNPQDARCPWTESSFEHATESEVGFQWSPDVLLRALRMLWIPFAVQRHLRGAPFSRLGARQKVHEIADTDDRFID